MSTPVTQPRSRVPRMAEAAVERARLTVVPRTRRVRAARVPFVILISAIMLGGVVGLLLFNTSLQQASFTATTLEGRAANLAAREQQLAQELEELRAPQRLAAEARRQGMRTPPATAFLLPDGSVVGEEVPAAADDGERIHPPAPKVPADLVPAPVVVGPDGEPVRSEDDSPVPGEVPPEGVLPTTDDGAASGRERDERGTTEASQQTRQTRQSQQPQQTQQR